MLVEQLLGREVQGVFNVRPHGDGLDHFIAPLAFDEPREVPSVVVVHAKIVRFLEMLGLKKTVVGSHLAIPAVRFRDAFGPERGGEGNIAGDRMHEFVPHGMPQRAARLRREQQIAVLIGQLLVDEGPRFERERGPINRLGQLGRKHMLKFGRGVLGLLKNSLENRIVGCARHEGEKPITPVDGTLRLSHHRSTNSIDGMPRAKSIAPPHIGCNAITPKRAKCDSR